MFTTKRHIAWTLLAGFCLIFAWVKTIHNEQQYRALQRRRVLLAPMLNRMEARRKFIFEGFGDVSSRRRLEQVFNEGRPFDLQRHDLGHDQVVVHDAAAVMTLRLFFQDDELSDWSIVSMENVHARRMVFIRDHPLERLREWVWIAGAAGWWLAFITLLVASAMRRARAWRPVTAEVMLAAAVIAFTAELVRPTFAFEMTTSEYIPLPVIDRDDLTMVALPMVLLSALALACVLPALAKRKPVRWRFSLRKLLLATAVCCTAAAMGENGLAALVTAVAAAALFLLVRAMANALNTAAVG